ncbi:hypothetical protein D3C72_1314220 [compost metagenome]
MASAFIFIAVLASVWKCQKLQPLPVISGSIEEWFSTISSLPGLRWFQRATASTSAVTTDEPEPPVTIALAPWSMAACSALWLSCAESLLSNCSSCSFMPPSTPPLALMSSMAYCVCISISSPTLANGPDSGSM